MRNFCVCECGNMTEHTEAASVIRAFTTDSCWTCRPAILWEPEYFQSSSWVEKIGIFFFSVYNLELLRITTGWSWWTDWSLQKYRQILLLDLKHTLRATICCCCQSWNWAYLNPCDIVGIFLKDLFSAGKYTPVKISVACKFVHKSQK